MIYISFDSQKCPRNPVNKLPGVASRYHVDKFSFHGKISHKNSSYLIIDTPPCHHGNLVGQAQKGPEELVLIGG